MLDKTSIREAAQREIRIEKEKECIKEEEKIEETCLGILVLGMIVAGIFVYFNFF